MKFHWKFFFTFIILSLSTLPLTAMSNTNDRQVIFIMLGAPGAGKGTQAVRLSEKFEIPQISTGDLFRENLRNSTPIGQKAKSYMDKGELVPDAVVMDMLFDRIAKPDCAKGYILDGCPRTIPQAETLDQHLSNSHAQMIAISLEVSDELIVDRLTGRLVCDKCGAIYHRTATPPKLAGICDRDGTPLSQRKDDNAAIVVERLKIFHEQTEPLKDYFQKKGILVLIDGSVSKEKTNTQIDIHLSQLL